MTRWIRSTKDPDWAALFTGYARSAFRLEAQQTYSNDAEDAAVARFVAGEAHDLEFSWALPKIQQQVAAGRTQTTVRVVQEPLTDYTRFELAVFPEFAAAGEDIRIIAADAAQWPAGVPQHDYWLFDDRAVWRMHYDEHQRFAGAELLEGEAAISDHLQWRDRAVALSVPLHEYLATRSPGPA
jgi:hypothetical protein